MKAHANSSIQTWLIEVFEASSEISITRNGRMAAKKKSVIMINKRFILEYDGGVIMYSYVYQLMNIPAWLLLIIEAPVVALNLKKQYHIVVSIEAK